jgi:hypothetical protein
MPKIGAHRARPAGPALTAEAVQMFVTQLAMQANDAQARTDRDTIRMQQEVRRIRLAEQTAELERATTQMDADLAAVAEKHKKTIAARLRALFPSLAGREHTAVDRSTTLLRSNKSAALAKYAALPMSVANNAVALPLPITPDLVEELNQLVSASQQAVQQWIEQNSAALGKASA